MRRRFKKIKDISEVKNLSTCPMAQNEALGTPYVEVVFQLRAGSQRLGHVEVPSGVCIPPPFVGETHVIGFFWANFGALLPVIESWFFPFFLPPHLHVQECPKIFCTKSAKNQTCIFLKKWPKVFPPPPQIACRGPYSWPNNLAWGQKRWFH